MTKPAKNEGQLRVTQPDGVSKERALADVALDPLSGAAVTVSSFSKPLFGPSDLTEICTGLNERARDVRQNNLASVENMLTAQAASLNAIFVELSRRSGANMGEYLDAADRYMRLALKAQGQCRATLETLAAIKNPPVVYARQANIASGPQQVNNQIGSDPRAGNDQVLPNELLETKSGEVGRVDPGQKTKAIACDSIMEAVGELDRSADRRRKETRQQERLQRG